MAKRNSSISKLLREKPALVLAVVIAIVLLAGFLFGWQQALILGGDLVGVDLRPILGEPAAGVATEQLSGSGDFYNVYFTDPPLDSDNAVYEGGTEEHLIDLINSAQTSIDTAMFEFDLQNVADALIAAHERGVRVRVVHDNEHTEEDPQIEQLAEAGIPVTPDERSALMHNKFYVFDGNTVWMGSMNITENGVYRNNNNVLVIQSQTLASNYTTEFEEMFNGAFGPTSPVNTPNPRVRLGDTLIESYFSPEDEPLVRIIEVVRGAQQSIHFMAFSYTDDDLAKAMMDRMGAGVEVQGIFESRGANTEYSECPTLLDAGATVRLDANPRTFHHKVVIVDEQIVITGSFNFSANATESNDENLLIVHNAEIAGLYEQEFDRRMAQSRAPSEGECLAAD